MPSDLKPRAVLFDVYRTLVDIWTDEHRPEVWTRLSSFLRYRGLNADAAELQREFFERSHLSQKESTENHPEVDVLGVFRGLLAERGYTGPDEFAEEVTQLFRVLSMQHLDLFPDTIPTLKALREKGFKTGLVSDAQRVFLEPELRLLGLPEWVTTIVISSDFGYQKPDPRLFATALGELRVPPEEALYVGDTVTRDICGAKEARLTAILINRDGRADRHGSPCQPDFTFRSLDEFRAWLLD
ncbi:MAG TPA: HAD family hydrolase [Longimicrobium sp.]|nr:HAD family hydrolase [Longimicrobium sp.]